VTTGTSAHSGRWASVAVLCAAALVAVADIGTVPLDAHEIYVVGTAREMHARHDWLIPYFEGRPRLNKPPLSYWATRLASSLDPSRRGIRDWHGRLPSALAAVGLCLVTMLMARRLFEARSAVLSGLVLSTTVGYYTYAHDARPDMLYAFWCGAGLVGFLVARDASDANRSTLRGALVMWVGYGLATLTKGPQMPATFVVATGAYCVMRRMGWRTTVRIHRPVTGLLVVGLMTLPWWIALHLALGGDGLRGTQLAGSLFTSPHERALEFYYVFRPLKFLLPWALLIPVVPWVLLQDLRTSAALQFLTAVVVIPVVLLSAGPHHRVHYVLPCLGAASILLARAGLFVTDRVRDQAALPRAPRQTGQRILQRILAWAPPVHWIGIAGVAIALGFVADRAGPATRTRAILTLAMLGALGPVVFHPRVRVAAVTQLGLLFVVALVGLGGAEPLWSRRRAESVELGRLVRQQIEPATPVMVLGGGRVAIGHYAGRRLRQAKVLRDIVETMHAARDTPLAAIVPRRSLRSLPPDIAVTRVPARPTRRQRRRVLVLLRAREGERRCVRPAHEYDRGPDPDRT